MFTCKNWEWKIVPIIPNYNALLDYLTTIRAEDIKYVEVYQLYVNNEEQDCISVIWYPQYYWNNSVVLYFSKEDYNKIVA